MQASTAGVPVLRSGAGVTALVLVLACGGGAPQETEACADGDAGCPCDQDEACADGLACTDQVCADAATEGSSSDGSGLPSTSSGASTETGGTTLELTSSGASATLGCEFVCSEDAPAFVCSGPLATCDPFHQDCPHGEKCLSYDEDSDGALDGSYCAPIVDDAIAGESCVVDESGFACYDTCARGLRCWGVDPETGEGRCTPLCEGSLEAPSCAAPDHACLVLDDGALNLCVPSCDPLVQDCEEGEQCVGAPASPVWACVPSAADGMAVGSPCTAINECEPGLTCVDVERFPAEDCGAAPGCCAAFCELGNGDEDCLELPISELSCEPYDEGDERPQDVGLCLPAP